MSDSAIAAVMIVALEKRAFGSFASAVTITIVNAGGILGLSSTGDVGVALRCWESTSIGVLPRNGCTPVTIS